MFSMTEQPFYPTPSSMGALDGGYFPQHDPTGLRHSYLPTGGSTELPSPPFPQPPHLSPPESPCAGDGPPRPAGGPWLRRAPLWDPGPAGGAVAQGKASPAGQYQFAPPPLQRLDSFPSAFANHNLRLFPGSAPCLDVPRPFCLTTPTDVVLQQLLSHKPQHREIQPMGAQQSQPMSSCSQRQAFDVQGGVVPQHGYLLQEQYRPPQEQEMNYLLYSRPHAGPAHQTSYPSPTTANPALQTSSPALRTTTPAQTHADSTHSFTNSAQLTPPFSSAYGQVSNAQLYSQPEPAPSIPQTHFYYQSQSQNQSHLLDQDHLPSHNPNQNHHLHQNHPNQNPNQNQHRSENHLNHTPNQNHPQNQNHLNQSHHQNLNQSPHQTVPPSGLHLQLMDDSHPLPCDQYGSDSSCPALLSPAHLSPLDPSPTLCQPHPLLPAANHSSHQQRSEVEFHAPAPPPCRSPGAPQWTQVPTAASLRHTSGAPFCLLLYLLFTC